MKFITYLFIKILRNLRGHYRNYKCYVLTGCVPSGGGSMFHDSENIVIGTNFSMGVDCKLYAQDKNAKITMGDNISLNDNVTINADNGGLIEIGNNVMVGAGTVMRASNHNFQDISQPFREQEHISGVIKIGDNVWFGAGVIVLPDVSVGDNVVIGAGSIVTKDITTNSLALGSPAKVIRKLNSK